jgi:hypothetical protein
VRRTSPFKTYTGVGEVLWILNKHLLFPSIITGRSMRSMEAKVSYCSRGGRLIIPTLKAGGWLHGEFRFTVWWLLQQKLVCREKNMGTGATPKLGEDLIQTNDWSGGRRGTR